MVRAVEGVLYDADEIVARYVQSLCGGGFAPGQIYKALGVLGPDGLCGGVIFSNYQPSMDMTLTVASVDWTKCGHPRVIARCLALPFLDLGLSRITAEIEVTNDRSLRNAKKLGFVEEGFKRRSNVVVLGLLKEDFVFRKLMPNESTIAPAANAA